MTKRRSNVVIKTAVAKRTGRPDWQIGFEGSATHEEVEAMVAQFLKTFALVRVYQGRYCIAQFEAAAVESERQPSGAGVGARYLPATQPLKGKVVVTSSEGCRMPTYISTHLWVRIING